MTEWCRYPWRPVILICLLTAQLHLASLHQCGRNSYSSAGKCCQYCKPGFEMVSRCTDKEDTQCKPCAKRLFNDGFNYHLCQSCTQCNVGSGSQIFKNCTSSSDTVCQCTPGTQPVETFKLGVDCTPCLPGQFSLGGNTLCKPWTNCTAIGKRTLRAGSSRTDTECEDARSSRPPRRPPTSVQTPATTSSTVHLRITTQSVVLNTLQPHPDKPWSPLSVIFLVLLLLLLFGLAMLILGIYLSKRQLPAVWKPQGTHNFRMPIQEEHQSSLAKV
ncbi:tumor necrosis factor receptor superfamily member 4 isoform X2 [Notamacropus eugenii]|uniref:tumor necrosis factor receptor superfamily member 4 isoform X2 n=1 Tax=Notamacropus eugenii TaxID=9315 RepID=UPI003B67260B